MSTVTISAADVNKLRQQTGAGMMDCRKALVESNGDFEKAIDYLRAKGQKVAANRSDREAKEGVVIARSTGKHGIILQLSSETDFVAKNEEFIDFANQLADIALNGNVTSAEDLKTQAMSGVTVNEKLLEMVAKIGERIDVTRFETVDADAVVSYIHGNYRIGVLVGLSKEAGDTAGKDVAMQIAAMNPVAVDADSVSSDVIERERSIVTEQIQQDPKMAGKPQEMINKIAEGKLNAFFKEQTLLAQPFVKDSGKSVGDYLKSIDKDLTVTTFKRVAIG